MAATSLPVNIPKSIPKGQEEESPGPWAEFVFAHQWPPYRGVAATTEACTLRSLRRHREPALRAMISWTPQTLYEGMLSLRMRRHSFMAHVVGEVAPHPCFHCSPPKTYGPFTSCVILAGFKNGACTNCVWGERGNQCSLAHTSSLDASKEFGPSNFLCAPLAPIDYAYAMAVPNNTANSPMFGTSSTSDDGEVPFGYCAATLAMARQLGQGPLGTFTPISMPDPTSSPYPHRPTTIDPRALTLAPTATPIPAPMTPIRALKHASSLTTAAATSTDAALNAIMTPSMHSERINWDFLLAVNEQIRRILQRGKECDVHSYAR
ncbi:uncharacterized protein N7459_008922 [Penicillium hispanicum]|uniref:uncharacterized protein n=1 Tax=Penicillium hispanicum TaxID=1080232 RepID=UPI0025400B2F|nr:uncharacterized protein N7459_008922 [Penicillium hispanicum]KAJ5569492.1 hypothetical protein N7459_008922 [Penicillium hispanicum]